MKALFLEVKHWNVDVINMLFIMFADSVLSQMRSSDRSTPIRLVITSESEVVPCDL